MQFERSFIQPCIVLPMKLYFYKSIFYLKSAKNRLFRFSLFWQKIRGITVYLTKGIQHGFNISKSLLININNLFAPRQKLRKWYVRKSTFQKYKKYGQIVIGTIKKIINLSFQIYITLICLYYFLCLKKDIKDNHFDVKNYVVTPYRG